MARLKRSDGARAGTADRGRAAGAETRLVVTFDGGGEEISARIGRTTELRSGDRPELAMDTTAIYLFYHCQRAGAKNYQ